jgi:hypothetical protein
MASQVPAPAIAPGQRLQEAAVLVYNGQTVSHITFIERLAIINNTFKTKGQQLESTCCAVQAGH